MISVAEMIQKARREGTEEEKRLRRVANYLKSKGCDSESETTHIGHHWYAIHPGGSACRSCGGYIYWAKNLTSKSGKTVAINENCKSLHLCWLKK